MRAARIFFCLFAAFGYGSAAFQAVPLVYEHDILLGVTTGIVFSVTVVVLIGWAFPSLRDSAT